MTITCEMLVDYLDSRYCLLIPTGKGGYRISIHNWKWTADLYYRIRYIWETITFSTEKTLKYDQISPFECSSKRILPSQRFSPKVPGLDFEPQNPAIGPSRRSAFSYLLEKTVYENFRDYLQIYEQDKALNSLRITEEQTTLTNEFLALAPHREPIDKILLEDLYVDWANAYFRKVQKVALASRAMPL